MQRPRNALSRSSRGGQACRAIVGGRRIGAHALDSCAAADAELLPLEGESEDDASQQAFALDLRPLEQQLSCFAHQSAGSALPRAKR